MPPTSHPALDWKLDEIAIELTVYCNLKCKMCSVWEGKKHGPSGELTRRLLTQAHELGASSFIPCGGETFMRKDFVELLEYADELGYERSEVVTNGVLLKQHLDRLEKLPSVHLHVSLDGPAEIHNWFRDSQIYDQVLSTVKEAHDRGMFVGLSGVLMKPNMDHWQHIIDLAHEMGLPEVSFQPFQPEIDGFQRDHSRWTFEPSQRPDVEDKLRALREYAREKKVQIYTESILDLVPAYLFEGLRPIPPGGCFMPSRFMLVDVSGEVYPCFFMRDDSIGNVIEGDELKTLWHSETHTALQLLAISKRCPGCLAACSDIASFEGQS